MPAKTSKGATSKGKKQAGRAKALRLLGVDGNAAAPQGEYYDESDRTNNGNWFFESGLRLLNSSTQNCGPFHTHVAGLCLLRKKTSIPGTFILNPLPRSKEPGSQNFGETEPRPHALSVQRLHRQSQDDQAAETNILRT